MNVIKSTTITVLCIISPFISLAQFGVGSTEDIKAIKKTETLFALVKGHDV